MVFYIARRFFWTAIVVAAVLAITFIVFFLLPAGDPALRFAGKNAHGTGAAARSGTGSASTSRGTCSSASTS